MWDDERTREAVHAELVDAGRLTPVGPDPDANREWARCDLANMVEGAFQVKLDPTALDADAERRWCEQLAGMYRMNPKAPDPLYGVRYWILDEGRRVGTVSLDLMGFGSAWQRVQGLYVLPAERGRGHASDMLRLLAFAAVRRGLAGIRLATSWTWQKSLRFYLDRDFWVVLWKHDIQLALEPDGPSWQFEIEGDVARLDVIDEGRREAFFTAERDGDRCRSTVIEAIGPRGSGCTTTPSPRSRCSSR
jgi:GNAT superfamily N-acetyltransferase